MREEEQCGRLRCWKRPLSSLQITSVHFSLSLSLNANLWPRCCASALWGSRCLTAVVTLDPTWLPTSDYGPSFLPWVADQQTATLPHSVILPSPPRPGSIPLWNPELRRRKNSFFPHLFSEELQAERYHPQPKGEVPHSDLHMPSSSCPHTSHIDQWPAAFLARYVRA